MVSKKIVRTGAQKTPMHKTYEISTGQDSLNTDFLGEQTIWLDRNIYSLQQKW